MGLDRSSAFGDILQTKRIVVMLIQHMTPSCSPTAGMPGAAWTHGRFAAPLRRLTVTGALAAALLGAVAAPPRYQMTVLPSVPGQASVFPRAMNEAGDIVAAAGPESWDGHVPLLYAAGGMTLLPTPPGYLNNTPLDLNETGLVVGSLIYAAFYWQGAGGDYLPGSGMYMQANGVNAAGQIVGSLSWDKPGSYPVYWPNTQSPMQFLQGLSQSGIGSANAINDAGQIAGSAGGVAVRWAHASAAPTVIGHLPGASGGEALAINSAGDLAGSSSYPPSFSYTKAMFYDEATGQVVGLGTLGGNYSVALSINDAQAVVGASGESEHDGLRGFLWLHGSMYDLTDLVDSSNVPISAVTKAVAINNAGQIAAEVVLPGGEIRAARLTPLGGAAAIPAVSALGLATTALLLAGLGFLLLRRRLPGTG